jgi:hypothetical protein
MTLTRKSPRWSIPASISELAKNDATRAVVEPPMYYCIIGRYAPPLIKRKWLRNEFCSECGKGRTNSWQV